MIKAIVRTVVPIIVGVLLHIPLAGPVLSALGVDQGHVTAAVTAVLGALVLVLAGVWHSAVSALERRWPVFGVLLGWVGAPAYPRKLAPVIVPPHAEGVGMAEPPGSA